MEQLPWSVVFRVLLGLLSFVPASAVFEPDLNDRESNICLFFVFFPCSAKPSAFDSCFDVKQVKIKKKKERKKDFEIQIFPAESKFQVSAFGTCNLCHLVVSLSHLSMVKVQQCSRHTPSPPQEKVGMLPRSWSKALKKHG